MVGSLSVTALEGLKLHLGWQAAPGQLSLLLGFYRNSLDEAESFCAGSVTISLVCFLALKPGATELGKAVPSGCSSCLRKCNICVRKEEREKAVEGNIMLIIQAAAV